ncbi:MAG: hypothetical protein M1503_02295 [Thaumarchaeota archaeon]|nr:hypothetical protein [Nitrososphaerota archaeon]MCL5317082.1 hypothetical protein [Nitrososphaerota archaeon]
MRFITKIMIPVILASLIPISTSLIAIQTYGLAQGDPAIYMQATPDSQTVPIGGSAEISVSAIGQEGFEGKVRMSAEGAPAGVTVTFDPNPVDVPEYSEGVSKMKVTAAKDTPAGSATLTVTGTALDNPKVTESVRVTIKIGGTPAQETNTTTTTTTTNITTTSTTSAAGASVTVTNTTTVTSAVTVTTTEVITTLTSAINTKTAVSNFTQASDIMLPVAALIISASLVTVAGVTIRNRTEKTRI